MTPPADARPRARDHGITIGILPTGPLNAITDVAGVRVGHVTLVEGATVRTGVTAILPHGGNLYQDKVPAGFAVGNGYRQDHRLDADRRAGRDRDPDPAHQHPLGRRRMQGIVDWTLALPGNEEVRSVNAVVGETNDGYLNDIRARHVSRDHARAAIEAARDGPVQEGSVGAGTGTVAFGWKGGIGTASRRLPANLGDWTIGVLVQSNFGGALSVDGVRVGEALGQYYLANELQRASGDCSVIVIIATDAPPSRPQLAPPRRVAPFSASPGPAGPMTNGSGDYALAFSTNQRVRRTPARREAAARSRSPRSKCLAAFPGGGRGDRGGRAQFALRQRRHDRPSRPDRGAAGRSGAAAHIANARRSSDPPSFPRKCGTPRYLLLRWLSVRQSGIYAPLSRG